MVKSMVENEINNVNTALSDDTFDPSVLVEKHGDFLYRFAMFRVRDEFVAEDLVQETLLAALQSLDKFSHKSSERTWLTGILKHKIIDHFRKMNRYVSIDSNDDDSTDENFFREDGHWQSEQAPTDWNASPSALVENKEFWEILNQCLASLPPRTAAAFTLREIEGLSSDEVCSVLDISPNNLWVMLHRARTQLRHDMEVKFFNPKKKDSSTFFRS
jgi:RNA polymerase sigma-70 factor (ECF subfamily)